MFGGLLAGYASYYLTRGALTFTAPVMLADPSIGLDLAALGAMTSAFPLAYGASKLVSGLLGARFSPRALLAGGLAATAVTNLAFGATSSPAAWCALWAANGLMQGIGAPTCASVLTRWFATAERGTYWGLWSISHNVGGFVAPILIGKHAPLAALPAQPASEPERGSERNCCVRLLALFA